MELETQRKDKERQEEEVTEEWERFMMQEMARGFSLSEEALLVFEAQDLCRTVHEVCSSHSECSPVLLSHLWWEKKRNGSPLQYSCLETHGQRSLVGYSPWGCKELVTTEQEGRQPHITGLFFSRGYIELNWARNQNLCYPCQAWVKLQLALHLLSFTSTISYLLSLLLLPVHLMPACKI